MKACRLFLLGACTVALAASQVYFLAMALPVLAVVTPPADTGSKSMINEICAYEKQLFERSFDGETSVRRLDRLDTFIFGATNKGSAQARIAKIAKVVPLTAGLPAKTEAASTQQPQPGVRQVQPQAAPALESPGNYPHITALEAKILGQTYGGQPLTERLARLETKAFGAPSKSQDLEARTDAIDRYQQARLRPKDMTIGTRPDEDDDDDADLMKAATSIIPRQFGNMVPDPVPRQRYESADEDAGAIVKEQAIQQELADAEKTAPPTTEERTLSRIAWCEQQIFGHAYPDMHLLQRLHQLNHELNPNDKEKDINLMDHIDAIVKEVVLLKQPHQPSNSMVPNKMPTA